MKYHGILDIVCGRVAKTLDNLKHRSVLRHVRSRESSDMIIEIYKEGKFGHEP